MKKKFLFTFLTLLIVCIAVINVNAKTAKAPSTVPAEGSTLYSLLDEPFDFSKINFSNADGTGTIPGLPEMKKIMVTANPVMTGATEEEILGDNWFTVYCLDGNLKFPMFNVFDFPSYTITNVDEALSYSVMFALFNEIEFYDSFLKVVDYMFYPSVSGIEYDLADGTTKAELFSSLNNGEEITVNFKRLVYSEDLVVTAADLSKDATAEYYPLTFSKEDIMMSKYSTKVLSDKNYNHALWIIEHSYPTLDLKSSLKLADADYDSLLTEITALYSDTDPSETELAELLENYVYATIQYAIWKANGYNYNGQLLGDTLNNSIELNKLYQYLIRDRSEYDNYSSLQFSEDIKLNKPKEDKIIAEETKDSYTYGPYSVSADFLSIGDINVSITSEVKNKVNNTTTKENNTSTEENKTDTPPTTMPPGGEPPGGEPPAGDPPPLPSDETSASLENTANDLLATSTGSNSVSMMTSTTNACSIVDKSGNVITTVVPGQEFYIKCNKADNIANVKIKVTSDGALTFYPASSRGRTYYSYYAAAQNVISGGKIVTKDIDLEYELIFNPKTGVENIAILFVISLIAFSLGYLVLSYKNKPVELN